MSDGSASCPACGRAAAQSVGGGAAAAPAMAPAASSGNDNVIALLCWSPVAIIGIIMGLAVEPYKSSKLVRFHAWQSLFTCIALVAISIGLTIVSTILGMLGPLVLIMLPIYFVYGFGCLGLMVYMMIQAFGAKMTKLPVVGNFAAKQAGI
jgi:uncharacterized membrane protein